MTEVYPTDHRQWRQKIWNCSDAASWQYI